MGYCRIVIVYATGVGTVGVFFAHNGLLVILKISFQQITEKKNRYTGCLAVLGFSVDSFQLESMAL